jgi:hypothetical protein
MKYFKKIIKPAEEIDVVDFIACDVCNKKIETTKKFEINEVEIKHRKGNNFPEEGSGTEISFDICENCFNEKVVPFLKGIGCEPRESEWSW